MKLKSARRWFLNLRVWILEGAISFWTKNEKIYKILSETYLELGNKLEATGILESGVQINPASLELRSLLAFNLINRNAFCEALQHLEYCVEHCSSPEEKHRLANFQANLGWNHLLLGNFQEAEKLLNSSRKIAPWDMDACIGLIHLYYDTERIDNVLPLLDEYIASYPNLYPPYVWLGNHYQYFLYDVNESKTWYRQALKYLNDKKGRKYCERFSSCYSLPDEFINTYVELLLNTGDEVQALSLIHSNIPNKFVSKHSRKILQISYLINIKDYAQAEQIAQEFSIKEKDNEDFLRLLALVQSKQGKFETAINNIRSAVAFNPESILSLAGLAEIQMNNSLWESALITYEKVFRILPISPSSPDWLENMALCNKKLDILEQAQKFYEKVIKLDPFDAVALVDLGEIYFELGEYSLARSCIKKGLSFKYLNEQKRHEASGILQKLNPE